MNHPRFFLLMLCIVFLGLLSAQTAASSDWASASGSDQLRTYQSPKGWEIQVPEEAEESVEENYVRWKSWFGNCWVKWSVGLADKESEVHFGLPMVKRYHADSPYQPFPQELNPGLAARKGFRPSIRRYEDTGDMCISILVDFDAENLLSIYFSWSMKQLAEGEAAWKQLLATVKAKPQANYPVSDLVAHYFDPVRHTKEEVAGLEGPLKGKVDHFYWEMPDEADWDSLYYYDPLVAALPDGGFVVAWRDTSHRTNFQFFSPDFKPRGASIPFPGLIVHAITGDNQGFAGIFSNFEGDYLEYKGHTWLIGFDLKGKQRFRTLVVGTDDIDQEDESILFRRRKNQCLAFSGSHYCVYVSIEHNFGAKGVHEGDYSRFYDENGVVVRSGDGENAPERGDNWGVSHSFTKSLHWDGDMFCFITVGDAHPRGIAYKRYGAVKKEGELWSEVNVWPIPGDLGENSVYDTEINSLSASPDIVLGTFSSYLKVRPFPGKDFGYPDIYLFASNKSGSKYSVKPLQVSPTLEEANPRIVRYRNLFLLVWSELDRQQKYPIDTYTERYLLLNDLGEKISRPEKLPTWFALEAPKTARRISTSNLSEYCGSDLVALKGGDVVWLRYLPSAKGVEILRIRK